MTAPSPPGLADRFRDHVAHNGSVPSDGMLVVACSGGLDSTVLLHLLRFVLEVDPARIRVAHFDHAWRLSSAGDARWVVGLARAWDLPVEVGTAAAAPGNEAEARAARYAFLDAVRARAGGGVILTAHHADDQAETVLFRVLRGTGIRGLGGIAPRGGGRVRPLLPYWKAELEAYADAVGLACRTDPTNLEPERARTVLRRVILPRAEAEVAPGARAALVRLARLARREEAAWEGAERILLEGIAEEEDTARIVLARPRLLAYDPPVRARVLRAAARRLGLHLSEAGTRVAMEFTSRGASGRRIPLAAGLRLGRSFDRLEMSRSSGSRDGPADRPLLLPGTDAGEAPVVLGGRRLAVRWSTVDAPPATHVEAFDPDALRFPLRLRAWSPGDRMRFPYGTKKIVKLLAEARVPREERHRVAVLADGSGRILWVPGLARGADAVPVPGGGQLYIGVEDADSA